MMPTLWTVRYSQYYMYSPLWPRTWSPTVAHVWQAVINKHAGVFTVAITLDVAVFPLLCMQASGTLHVATRLIEALRFLLVMIRTGRRL